MNRPAGDDDGFLAVPDRIVRHHLGVGRDVLRRQLRQLVGLRVNPAQRLHLLNATAATQRHEELFHEYCSRAAVAFSALTLLVGRQEGYPIRPVKTEQWGAGVVICLEQDADLHLAQLMPLPLMSLASVKSRLVLPFWYWLTWVVPDKGPLIG